MKLAKGDRVWIKALPSSWFYFPQNRMATVERRSEYPPYEWALIVDGYGYAAWYPPRYLEVKDQVIA